jgi:hypothetical protein
MPAATVALPYALDRIRTPHCGDLLNGSRFDYLSLRSPTRHPTNFGFSARSKNDPAPVQSSPPHQNPTAEEPSPKSDGMPEL